MWLLKCFGEHKGRTLDKRDDRRYSRIGYSSMMIMMNSGTFGMSNAKMSAADAITLLES